MNYEEFKSYAEAHVTEFLSSDIVSAHLDVVEKNNGRYDALVFEAKEKDVPVPIIRIKDFFPSDSENVSELFAERCVEKMAQAVNKELKNLPNFDVNKVSDFDSVKAQIVPRVINMDNEGYLRNKAYTQKADLAVTYHILLSLTKENSVSIPITNEMAEKWGVSNEVLEHTATDNIGPVLKPVMLSMLHDVLPELSEELGVEMSVPVENDFFLISGMSKSFGASVFLDNDFMDRVSAFMGEDFYILPSSIHELLCVKESIASPEELKEMVCAVNSTEVSPEVFLSNNVYKYDNVKHELYNIDDEQKRNEQQSENQKRSLFSMR